MGTRLSVIWAWNAFHFHKIDEDFLHWSSCRLVASLSKFNVINRQLSINRSRTFLHTAFPFLSVSSAGLTRIFTLKRMYFSLFSAMTTMSSLQNLLPSSLMNRCSSYPLKLWKAIGTKSGIRYIRLLHTVFSTVELHWIRDISVGNAHTSPTAREYWSPPYTSPFSHFSTLCSACSRHRRSSASLPAFFACCCGLCNFLATYEQHVDYDFGVVLFKLAYFVQSHGKLYPLPKILICKRLQFGYAFWVVFNLLVMQRG